MNVIGDVKNADCILIDDIVDSAGTLCNAAVALMDQGAKSVSAYVTHGVLSGGAVARVAASPMEKMVITDSIQPTEAVRVSPNVRPLSIAIADGRGDEAHCRRDVGVEFVRLGLFDWSGRRRILEIRRWAPLEATPRVRETENLKES